MKKGEDMGLINLLLEKASHGREPYYDLYTDSDRDYIALLPTEEIAGEDGEVYLYRYAEDAQGNPSLTNIESDEEFEIVSDRFDEWLDEQEYAEMSE